MKNQASILKTKLRGRREHVGHYTGPLGFTAAFVVALTACVARADTSVHWSCHTPFWTDSEAWGLQPPCYPNNGSCVVPKGPPEPRWHVTLIPSGCAPGDTPYLDTDVTITELIVMNGGTLGGPDRHDLTVEENLLWIGDNDSALNGSGAVRSLGTLTMNGQSPIGTTRHLINDGNATLTGHLTLAAPEGHLSNSLGAVFALTDDGEITGQTNFTNDGLLQKVGNGVFTLGIVFTNSAIGVVDIQSGTLRIASDGGSASGRFSVTSGTVLEFATPFSTPFALNGDATLEGQGTIRIVSHSVDSMANWNFEGTTTVSSGVLNLLVPATTRLAVQTGGRITGDFVVTEHLDWQDGTMGAPGSTFLQGDADITTGGAQGGPVLESRELNSAPGHAVNLLTNLGGGLGATINNPAGATFNMGASMNRFSFGDFPTFNNDGAFIKLSPNPAVLGWTFVNRGLVEITDGDLVISGAPFTQSAGETRLDGARLLGDMIQIQGGQLTGSGQISCLTTNGGRISPGSPSSAGSLQFNATVTLATSSVLAFKLGGRNQGTEYDFISMPSFGLDLNGELELDFINDFQNVVTPSDTFTLLQVCCPTALHGSFANVSSGSDLATADGFGRFTVYYGADSPYPANQVVITNFRP